MRNTPEPSTASGRRVLLGLGGVAVLVALTLPLWLWTESTPVPPPPATPETKRDVPAPAGAAPRAPSPPPRRAPAPSPLPTGDALAAALGEERVTLASSMRVEDIEQDRAWVCAGEVMRLSARVGGEPEPGAVSRWVWPTEGGRAELQPGPALQWRAPAGAGSYPMRFQVCMDLGGRRVGVLAEREILLDVRPCGEGEGQRQEPLRLGMAQRGQGEFTFQALYPGTERVLDYTWDFGDGTRRTTPGAEAEHTYALASLEPQETRSFTVRVQARLERGPPLEATAFALARGQPPADEPPPVELQVSRWRPLAEGEGWRSDVVVRAPAATIVTWERLERVYLGWDGEPVIDTRSWSERVHVEETLERGGFRGYVTVSRAEAAPGLKQILDFLYGRDAAGKEVMVSWSPFKREPPAEPPRASEPSPEK